MITGTDLISLAKEAVVDGIKWHGTKYIEGILVSSGLTYVSGGVLLLPNSTKILKYAKIDHSVYAAA